MNFVELGPKLSQLLGWVDLQQLVPHVQLLRGRLSTMLTA